jgi:uncharacterized membrane protein YwaF
VFDTNFGDLRAKTSYISLFDYMATWPFYIMQLVLLAIVSCLIIYSPYFLVDYGGDDRGEALNCHAMCNSSGS